MAYGFSTKDSNQIKKLTTENEEVLASLVNTWEQKFGRITETDKVGYVTGKFTDEFKRSFNWPAFAPNYNRAKAAIDILANLNSAADTFADQIRGIKDNIITPSLTNGGMQVFDNNNNKVLMPGFNVDKDFPNKFQNETKV